MKKVILMSAIALVSFSSFAQTKATNNAGITYGVKAGVTFPGMTASKSNNDAVSYAGRGTQFFGGGVVNVPVSALFTLQPGLSLVGKGFSTEETEISGGNTAVTSNKRTPLYLELPINMIASFDAGNGKFLVGAGPYVSLALGGKIKNSLVVNGVADAFYTDAADRDLRFGTNTDEDVNTGAELKDMKSFDFGLNFLVGYQLSNGLSINAGYGLGLLNLDSNAGRESLKNAKPSLKNSVFSVGLGFTF